MSRPRFTVESRIQRVLKDAASERKAKAMDASVTRAVAAVMAEHAGDRATAMRILIRRGAEQISAVVGPLEAATYLAKLAGEVAPAPNADAAKQAAEALFNLKQAKRGAA